MTGIGSTRKQFQDEIRIALDVAVRYLRAKFDDPGIALAIVDHRTVSKVAALCGPVFIWMLCPAQGRRDPALEHPLARWFPPLIADRRTARRRGLACGQPLDLRGISKPCLASRSYGKHQVSIRTPKPEVPQASGQLKPRGVPSRDGRHSLSLRICERGFRVQ